jgi:phosphoacetylglucosamine mutase
MNRDHLNDGAGANYLYTQKAIPSGYSAESAAGLRLCSLDGDADRLLYWRVANGKLDIMDGDKEMALASLWVRTQVDALGLEDVRMGVVKTAYANGASTIYAEQHHIPVTLTKTGVRCMGQ